jgi:predicted enzyme related to lactoylglutathione lyase
MARITWFEYFTDDAEKDLAFYKEAFGWTVQKWGDMPYWLVVTGDKADAGIDGAIGLPPMAGMTQKVVNTISVEDNDAAVAKAVAAGGTVVVPKRAVTGSGWLTYIADPAGIVFGIMQYDENAK